MFETLRRYISCKESQPVFGNSIFGGLVFWHLCELIDSQNAWAIKSPDQNFAYLDLASNIGIETKRQHSGLPVLNNTPESQNMQTLLSNYLPKHSYLGYDAGIPQCRFYGVLELSECLIASGMSLVL